MEGLTGTILNVVDELKKEMKKQINLLDFTDKGLNMDTIQDNINMYFDILNIIYEDLENNENIKYDSIINVFENPMGGLMYKLIDLECLKDTYDLEGWYNILCKNEPSRTSYRHEIWSYLESICYEELLDENEHIKECEHIIDEIVEFLKTKHKIIF